MSKLENFKGKQGSNSFKHRPEDAASYGGRPVGFKKELRQIYNENGGVIWVEAYEVIERSYEGRKQYGLQLPKKLALVAKLNNLIMTAKDSVSLQGIKFLFKDILAEDTKSEVTINNNQIEINKTNVQYIVVSSLDQVPEEHQHKLLIQETPRTLPAPYNSEQAVRDKYGIIDS